ncbi:MAG: three-Cys-motif partner protein TcmP [Anaerolineae bacterium]|jgi:three-Cys-motif partner protein
MLRYDSTGLTGLPTLEDDGLLTPSTGQWARKKYRLVQYYSRLFVDSMRHKWDHLVYVDLFAGAGRARIRPAGAIVPASPLLAVDIPNRFTRYVFCEINKARIEVLEERVRRDFPSVDARCVCGDANEEASSILAEMPVPSRKCTVLSFCFVDPYRLASLRFETIRALSARYVDFLVLIPAYMDAQRNLQNYLKPGSDRVEAFLGLSDWRDRWKKASDSGTKFGAFVVEQFGSQMEKLGYHYGGLGDTELVRGTSKNIPLYRLVFFSRHSLGAKFAKQARKGTRRQLRMFEEFGIDLE